MQKSDHISHFSTETPGGAFSMVLKSPSEAVVEASIFLTAVYLPKSISWLKMAKTIFKI